MSEPYESPSDEEQPPLHFYLAQSKVSGFQETGGQRQELQPPSTVEETKSLAGQTSQLRPTPMPMTNMLEDPALNYHVPQFEASGNFGEVSESLFGSTLPGKSAPKRNLLIRGEEEEIEPNARAMLQVERTYKDVPFGVAFALCFLVMFVVAVVVHVQGAAKLKPIEDIVGDIAYVALSQSMSLIIFLSAMGIVCGAIMIFLFRFFIKITVWATLSFSPLILFICSVWAFANAASPRTDSNTAMIVLGILTLFFSLGLVVAIFVMKRQIDTTVAFLKLACDVLKERGSILLVSVINSIIFLLFTALWYWSFAWIYMLGHEEVQDSETVWVLNPSSYVVSSFLVFMYIWTASVVNYIQSFVLAEITCHWYYHRHDFSAISHNPTKRAFRHALTTSFGSICLASLVYSILRFLQFFLRQILKVLPNKQSTITNCFSVILESMSRLVDSVNKFALAYCALSGDGFCHSTKVTFGIFRRNLLDRVSIATISHFVMIIWVVSISMLFSFSLFTYATHTLGSVYGWLVGMVTFMISFFVLRFYADIILNISDTLFLCYAIDCDSNTSLLGAQQTPNQAVHRTLEVIFHENQNVVVYDDDEL